MNLVAELLALFGGRSGGLATVASMAEWSKALDAERDSIESEEARINVAARALEVDREKLAERRKALATDEERFHIALRATTAQSVGVLIAARNTAEAFSPKKESTHDRN